MPPESRTSESRLTAAPLPAGTVADLLALQDGVISRAQVLAAGHPPGFIRCRLRRRDWAPIHPGVYVHHTGPPTWRQRAWAAILDAWPAALGHGSALTPGTGALHIVVDRQRTLTARPGVVVHRRSRLAQCVDWHRSPPRLSVAEAVLDVADSAPSETLAIAALTDAVGRRLTTADRLLAAVGARPRMRRRDFLVGILYDIAHGTCSVLEHRYLTDVEQAHGLPTPIRQAPTTVGRRGFRDADYPDYGMAIELDGRFGHDDPVSRDRDLERDLDAATAAGRDTLRLGAGQVLDRPCPTAAKVAAALVAHGWTGRFVPCPRCPDYLRMAVL